MKFNDFQSMMHDLWIMWGKGYSPEQIANWLIWDYLQDRDGKLYCNVGEFTRVVQNTLRC